MSLKKNYAFQQYFDLSEKMIEDILGCINTEFIHKAFELYDKDKHQIEILLQALKQLRDYLYVELQEIFLNTSIEHGLSDYLKQQFEKQLKNKILEEFGFNGDTLQKMDSQYYLDHLIQLKESLENPQENRDECIKKTNKNKSKKQLLENSSTYKHYLQLKREDKLIKNPDPKKFMNIEFEIDEDGSREIDFKQQRPLQLAINNKIFCEPLLFLDERVVYCGELVENKRQGFGFQIFEDGSFYEGSFKDDSGNGFGRLIFSEGDIFIGDFKDFEFNGVGEYFKANGDIMKGTFKGDLAHGRLIVKYYDGAYYQGQFNRGKKEGKGTFLFPNGDQYNGYFFENQFHGNGVFLDKEKNQTYKGKWENNQILNPIQIKNANFKYFGNVKDLKMHGKGKILIDNIVYKGSWCNNEMHGYFQVKDLNNKTKSRQIFKNGELIQILKSSEKFHKEDFIDQLGDQLELYSNSQSIYTSRVYGSNQMNEIRISTIVQGNSQQRETNNNIMIFPETHSKNLSQDSDFLNYESFIQQSISFGGESDKKQQSEYQSQVDSKIDYQKNDQKENLEKNSEKEELKLSKKSTQKLENKHSKEKDITKEKKRESQAKLEKGNSKEKNFKKEKKRESQAKLEKRHSQEKNITKEKQKESQANLKKKNTIESNQQLLRKKSTKNLKKNSTKDIKNKKSSIELPKQKTIEEIEEEEKKQSVEDLKKRLTQEWASSNLQEPVQANKQKSKVSFKLQEESSDDSLSELDSDEEKILNTENLNSANKNQEKLQIQNAQQETIQIKDEDTLLKIKKKIIQDLDLDDDSDSEMTYSEQSMNKKKKEPQVERVNRNETEQTFSDSDYSKIERKKFQKEKKQKEKIKKENLKKEKMKEKKFQEDKKKEKKKEKKLKEDLKKQEKLNQKNKENTSEESLILQSRPRKNQRVINQGSEQMVINRVDPDEFYSMTHLQNQKQFSKQKSKKKGCFFLCGNQLIETQVQKQINQQ